MSCVFISCKFISLLKYGINWIETGTRHSAIIVVVIFFLGVGYSTVKYSLV